ncbi:MAG: hypothetical protein WAL70_07745 [Aeromicrobium sp.]
MMGTQQLLRFATRRATRWYVDLDQVSRRNAMVASTALAQRRLEHVEVEEFLALHQMRHQPRLGVTIHHAVQRTG